MNSYFLFGLTQVQRDFEFFSRTSISSIFSGRVEPRVSGSRKQSKPLTIANPPRRKYGTFSEVTSARSPMKGVASAPTLAIKEQRPIPVALTEVGKSSDV